MSPPDCNLHGGETTPGFRFSSVEPKAHPGSGNHGCHNECHVSEGRLSRWDSGLTQAGGASVGHMPQPLIEDGG